MDDKWCLQNIINKVIHWCINRIIHFSQWHFPSLFFLLHFSLFVKIRNRRRAIKREVFDASMQILKYKNGHKISSSIFSSTHHYVKSIVWWDDFVENGSLFVLMRQKYIVGKYAIYLHKQKRKDELDLYWI